MSSLVRELQRDALERKVQITDLLRKTLFVARKLKVVEFEKWSEKELNEYKDEREVPAYREIIGCVNAWNPVHGWQRVVFNDSEIEHLVSNRPCGQSIAEIESLLEHQAESMSFHMPFLPEMENKLRKLIGYDTHVTLLVPHKRTTEDPDFMCKVHQVSGDPGGPSLESDKS